MNELKAGNADSKWINILLVLVPVILFLPALIPGKSLFWGISSIQFIPWHWAALMDIQQGAVPLWNTLNGMGAPLAANYQSAVFYPPTWLVFFAGWAGGITWMAWAHGVLIVLHLIWAGWGMKSLMAHLGVSPIPQVICGLAYCLSGYFVARGSFLTMVQSAAWIPWVILAASQISSPLMKQKDLVPLSLVKPVIYFALALSGQWLSGHAQLAWYTLFFTGVWLLYGAAVNGGGKTILRAVVAGMLGAVLSFLICAIQLFPTIEYFLQSQRSGVIDSQTALSYSYWPWRAITLIIPDFFGNPGRGDYWGYANYWENALYVGILPIFFAVNFLIGRGKWLPELFRVKIRQAIWFFVISVIIVVIFSLGWFTPVYPWLFEHVPSFGVFNGPARWMIIAVLCLIIIAGFGAEEWIHHGLLPKKRKGIWLTVTLAGMTGAGATWFLLPEINKTFSTSIFATGVVIAGYLVIALFKPEKENNNLWRFLVVGWFAVDLIWAGHLLNPVVDAEIYSQSGSSEELSKDISPGRYFWYRDHEVGQRFDRYFDFKDIRPTEDMYAIRESKLPNINILSNIAMVNNFDPMVPSRYSKFIETIETANADNRERYLALANVSHVSSIGSPEENEIDWKVIKPFAESRLVACAEISKDGEAALRWMKNAAEANELHDIITIEGNTQERQICHEGTSSNTAKISFAEHNDGVRIAIQENPYSQWLFMARTWYPGWQATIDGVDTDILRADYVFMAVQIPSGSHIIILKYSPVSFYIGRMLSFCGILIVVLGMSFILLRKRG